MADIKVNSYYFETFSGHPEFMYTKKVVKSVSQAYFLSEEGQTIPRMYINLF